MHSSYNLFSITLLVLLPLFFLLIGPVQIQAAEETETGEVQAPTTPPVSSPIPRPRMTAVPNGLLGQNYFIKRPGMGAGLTYEYKDESRTTSGTTVKDSYHRFKERVRLQTDGWLYHPALMQYSLMIEPEWIQSKEVNTSGETGRVNSFSPDYAMTATFLQQKPYTFNFFASRRESPVWAAFAGDTETLSTHTAQIYDSNIKFYQPYLGTLTSKLISRVTIVQKTYATISISPRGIKITEAAHLSVPPTVTTGEAPKTVILKSLRSTTVSRTTIK